jgi:hypothetical protein
MGLGLGTLLVGAMVTLMVTPALAQRGQPIGSTMVVVNRVTAELAQQARTLQTGDNVRCCIPL